MTASGIPQQRAEFARVADIPASQLAEELLNAFYEDALAAAARFTLEQIECLRLGEDHVAAAPSIRPEELALSPLNEFVQPRR